MTTEHRSRYEWIAFLYCPACGCTWRGLFWGERPGAYGAIPELCPDCDMETDDSERTS